MWWPWAFRSPQTPHPCEAFPTRLRRWSGLKGVQPPLPFGERTRDCSPGHTAKEGPHLVCWAYSLSWGTPGSRAHACSSKEVLSLCWTQTQRPGGPETCQGTECLPLSESGFLHLHSENWHLNIRVCMNVRSAVLDSLRPLWTVARQAPGKNTGVGCHFLLQGTFALSWETAWYISELRRGF